MILLYLQLLIYYVKVVAFVDIEDNEFSSTIFITIGFVTLAFTIKTTFFTVFFYKMSTLSVRILDLKMEENHKYKCMFNILEDPILMISGEAI